MSFFIGFADELMKLAKSRYSPEAQDKIRSYFKREPAKGLLSGDFRTFGDAVPLVRDTMKPKLLGGSDVKSGAGRGLFNPRAIKGTGK